MTQGGNLTVFTNEHVLDSICIRRIYKLLKDEEKVKNVPDMI